MIKLTGTVAFFITLGVAAAILITVGSIMYVIKTLYDWLTHSRQS